MRKVLLFAVVLLCAGGVCDVPPTGLMSLGYIQSDEGRPVWTYRAYSSPAPDEVWEGVEDGPNLTLNRTDAATFYDRTTNSLMYLDGTKSVGLATSYHGEKCKRRAAGTDCHTELWVHNIGAVNYLYADWTGGSAPLSGTARGTVTTTAAPPTWNMTAGDLWQLPDGRFVAYWQEGVDAGNSYIGELYLSVGLIHADTWGAPILVEATGTLYTTSYGAVLLEPSYDLLLAYMDTDGTNLWLRTRLCTWTGTTYNVGAEVTVWGPLALATYGFPLLGGMWQEKDGRVKIFYGFGGTDTYHIMSSTNRGASWT